MRFETHLHTVIGSYDGAITPAELIDWVRQSGVGGICITEHDYVWSAPEIEKLREATGVVVVRGAEVTTDMGHVLAYGLSEYVSGIHDIRVLRRVVDEAGGIMVLAHPFRAEVSPYYTYGHRLRGLPPWEEVLTRPVWQYVDALEACNASGTLYEEELVRKAARELGLPVTGGSDAHSAGKLGLCVTEFSTSIASQEEFVKGIRAGLCDGRDFRLHGKEV